MAKYEVTEREVLNFAIESGSDEIKARAKVMLANLDRKKEKSTSARQGLDNAILSFLQREDVDLMTPADVHTSLVLQFNGDTIDGVKFTFNGVNASLLRLRDADKVEKVISGDDRFFRAK